jgi:putative membrane protein
MNLPGQNELDRMADAVRRAEAGTSGEIMVVVERAAGAYRSLALVFCWMLALALPWPLIWLTHLSAQVIFITQLSVALALALIVSFRESWRMALTPRFMKRRKAHEAACREFILRGLSATRQGGGVLIYVALAERYAEVLVDSGVSEKIEAAVWREVVDLIVDAIRDDRLAEGIIAGVERIGDILASALPASDHLDELPNKVVVIS